MACVNNDRSLEHSCQMIIWTSKIHRICPNYSAVWIISQRSKFALKAAVITSTQSSLKETIDSHFFNSSEVTVTCAHPFSEGYGPNCSASADNLGEWLGANVDYWLVVLHWDSHCVWNDLVPERWKVANKHLWPKLVPFVGQLPQKVVQNIGSQIALVLQGSW